MIADPNAAFVLLALGVLGIYAGFCGRILLGVAGGVVAIVALASLLSGRTIANLHPWVAITVSASLVLIAAYLIRTAIRARANKAT